MVQGGNSRLQIKGSGIKRGTPGLKINQLDKYFNIGPVSKHEALKLTSRLHNIHFSEREVVKFFFNEKL